MAGPACWRCGREPSPVLLCPDCGAVHGPTRDVDHFDVLGLPPHPAIDEKKLADRYYELSRRVHPDRFQTADPRELAHSVGATAALNAAFQELRDVESRGRFWLRRGGEDLGRDNAAVPSALAATVFEIQEKLAELRVAGGSAREALRAEIDLDRAGIAGRRAERRASLEEMLLTWPVDGAPDAGSAAGRARLKELLSELSYLRTLERDIRAALEV